MQHELKLPSLVASLLYLGGGGHVVVGSNVALRLVNDLADK